MIQFHETGYGRRFFDFQLPEITRAIHRLAEAIETQNEILTPRLRSEVKAIMRYFEIHDIDFTGISVLLENDKGEQLAKYSNFDREKYPEDHISSNQDEVFTFPSMEVAEDFFKAAGYVKV